MHSPAWFTGIGGGADLRGYAVGFVGDRDISGNQPHPVRLPKKNSWEWLATDCVMDTVLMAAFFGNEDNMSKSWSLDEALQKVWGNAHVAVFASRFWKILPGGETNTK